MTRTLPNARAKRIATGHYLYRSRKILRAFGDNGLWRVYRADGTHDWAVSYAEAKRIVDAEHVPARFAIARDRVQHMEGTAVTTHRWWDGKRFVAGWDAAQPAKAYASEARALATLRRMVKRCVAFEDECRLVALH